MPKKELQQRTDEKIHWQRGKKKKTTKDGVVEKKTAEARRNVEIITCRKCQRHQALPDQEVVLQKNGPSTLSSYSRQKEIGFY